jgi:phage tail sheath protein FI
MPDIRYPGVYLEEHADVPPRIEGAQTSVTAFIGYTLKGPVNQAILIHGWPEYEKNFGGLHTNSHVSYAVYQFFKNGGQDAYVVRVMGTVNEMTPDAKDIIGDDDRQTGIYAMRTAAVFNIMAIPQTVALSDEEAWDVIRRAISFCEENRAMYLVDYNPACDCDSIEAWVSQLGPQKNAAVFFPRIEIADPLNQTQLIELPTSGTIAGLFARNDAARGVFTSPAGLSAELYGVVKLSLSLTDTQNGDLNRQGINCLRYFHKAGNVCWGARTLAGGDAPDSEWKYIPVRRLAVFIEESIVQGTQWVAFEQSGEPLWARLRMSIDDFLMRLWRRGAFQGATREQAFFVQCDTTTTTPADMSKGIVTVITGFAPVKPAEFSILDFKLQSAHQDTPGKKQRLFRER